MLSANIDKKPKIVNIISMPQGGGAEFLTRELHKIFRERGLDSTVIYSCSQIDNLDENEIVLGCSPRSFLNIFRIRKILREISRSSNNKLIVHAHLTWPLFFTTLAVIGIPHVNLIYTEHDTWNKRRKIPFSRFLDFFFTGNSKK